MAGDAIWGFDHSFLNLRAAAYAEGKKRDSLVLANRQLESARHFDRVAQVSVLLSSHASPHRIQICMQYTVHTVTVAGIATAVS